MIPAFLYRILYGFEPIPQAEIDAEVQRIMIEYGTGPAAVTYAAGAVERLQWSKNHRHQVKADKVLKELKRL